MTEEPLGHAVPGASPAFWLLCRSGFPIALCGVFSSFFFYKASFNHSFELAKARILLFPRASLLPGEYSSVAGCPYIIRRALRITSVV